MKKIFTFFLLLVASVSAIYASDIEVDGIWYDFDNRFKTATVTYRGYYPSFYASEYSGSVVIPSSVTYLDTTYSVTSIGKEAFQGCSSLTSVTIPNSVTWIKESAFQGCSSLTSVTIGESVTSIGESAFYNCSSLTSVTIPNSVTSIEKEAFRSCSSLTSVTIGESVTWIEESAFRSCSKLTSVTIGNGVMSIGVSVFNGCSSLTSVTIPNSVKSIGYYAFGGCSSLTSINIPTKVTSIEMGAFEGCSSLTSVTIGESVTWIGTSAFSGCSSLTSINIPTKVKSIGDYAFEGCSSLTSMTIPNSVTYIGHYAFDSCSSLTSVTINSDTIVSEDYESNSNISHIFGSQVTEYIIGNHVKGIGCNAFRDCSSLTTVTIGKSVTSIGESAFYGCSSLTSVTINSDAIVSKNYSSNSNISHIFGSQVTEYIIGESVTSIGDYAFSGCSSLTSINIPTKVTSIGYGTFYDCYKLTSVTIGESVTSIGKYAFCKCSSLTKTNYTGDIAGWCNIEFGNYDANPMYYSHNFYINDQEIKDLVIPESVKSIGDYAFYRCSSLTSVTIGESVKSIGDYAFRDCTSLTSVTIPNSVTTIGEWAFCRCSSLTSVTIGDGVTSIGNTTFSGCSSMTSVTIGESVTSIGWDAFSGCSSLTSVTINSDAIVSEDYEYNSNISHKFGSQVTEYIIGNHVKGIGRYAFCDCSSLTSVTIGESVKSIGERAFLGCSSLIKTNYTGDIAGWCNIGFDDNPMCYSHNFYINDQEIKDLVIPESVTSIGKSAFYNCSSLTSVTIGESVTSIGYAAFSGCSSLTSVTIGESVTSIGGEAFNGCSSLTSVTIGESVTSIGVEAFNGCSSLTSVTIPNSVTIIGEFAFYNCSSLTTVTIGESVKSIGRWAFQGCSSLTSVTIPNSVKSIGKEAFYGCSSLTSVTIGESVTSIGESAFQGCSSLTSITCEALTPPTISSAFDGVSKSIPVYVPCESIQRYREHNEWGRFQNLQCVKPEDPNPEVPQDSEMCLNSADERAVFFQGEEFETSANVYMWDPANDNKELVGSWPGSAATHLGDGKFKFVIPTSVTGDPSTWMIIWNNGIGGTQTEDLTFTMHGLYNMSGVQSVITTLCDGSNTDDSNEEVITCAEAVSICQQTGTTATTKEYTIRGYVTKIEAAYSEQYDNITFWMADTSPMQMDNSSNSVTSLSDYPNIALGKSTTASSSENSGTLPEYINDGDFSTRWSSEWQDNEYITIDLEQYSFIDHITLHWEFAYASQFAILITDEQPSSSALSSPLPSSATCYQSSGDVQTIPVAKSGRYITLIGIERATAYGISLYELEAYGMPLLQAYCVKPIQNTDKYVQIGDYVEAVGTLVNYGGTTPEINAGGTYTILTKHEENGSTTSVENTNTQSPITNCQKIIRNGQLLILRDGVEYTIMGQKL